MEQVRYKKDAIKTRCPEIEIDNTAYEEHTNPLFSRSNILKVTDLVLFQTAQITYRAINNQLLANIHVFSSRRGI